MREELHTDAKQHSFPSQPFQSGEAVMDYAQGVLSWEGEVLAVDKNIE
jgi:hypothetical protein